MKDYYKILEVPKNASQDEIKQAFRRLAKKWHPDVCKLSNAEAKFKEINEAYDALTNHKNNSSDIFGGFPNDLFDTFFSGRFQRTRGITYSIFEVDVDYLTMILGGKISIKIREGIINIEVPLLCQDGHVIEYFGDNINYAITLRVSLPKSLSKEQKKKLEELRGMK